MIAYFPTPQEIFNAWPMWIITGLMFCLYLWSLHKENVNRQLARMKGASDRRHERHMRESRSSPFYRNH